MADPSRTQAKLAHKAKLRRLARPALAGSQAFTQLPSPQAELLALQRLAGNQAVTNALSSFVESGRVAQDSGESALPQSQEVGESLWALGGSSSLAALSAPGETLWAQRGSAAYPPGSEADALPGEALWAQSSEASALPVAAPLSAFPEGQPLGKFPALAIIGPVVKSLKVVQNVIVFNANRLGVTTFPTGSKSPSYTTNVTSKKTKKGVVKFYAHPKWGIKAFEGNSQAFYIGAGWHKTTHVEKGAPVFWYMSPAMSNRDRAAEAEHSNDFKHAFKISLKEAHNILQKHIVGKTFGPAASKADAENKVKAAIKKKLAHPKLGNDQTKWAAKYTLLQQKTLIRDKSKWHTFAITNRKEVKTKKGVVKKVTYHIRKGSTKINVVKSSKLVKY